MDPLASRCLRWSSFRRKVTPLHLFFNNVPFPFFQQYVGVVHGS